MHSFLKYVTHPTYDEAWHNYTLPKVTRHSLSSAAVPCPAILWGVLVERSSSKNRCGAEESVGTR